MHQHCCPFLALHLLLQNSHVISGWVTREEIKGLRFDETDLSKSKVKPCGGKASDPDLAICQD